MPVTIVGNNTPTAGGVVYGDGANYVSTAAGTSGQVLTSNGAGAPAWATPAAGGGLLGIQVFTSSGTFTVPAGVTRVKVTVTGGGGGGTSGTGFGGSGATAIKYFSVSPGNTLSITIGGGGSAGSTGGSSTVVFGATTVTAGGGVEPFTFTPAVATNGDINIRGGSGGSGTGTTSAGMAVSFWGPAAFNIANGGAYGSGGGANGSRAGTDGVCVVEY